MEAIFKYLQRMYLDTGREWSLLTEKMHQVSFPKKYLILRPGQTEDYLSFVETGMLRFWVESEEKEITADFAFEGAFTSAYSSFITRTPTIFYMETLMETSLWRIHYDDLQDVYNHSAHGQMLGRIAAEQLFLRKTMREVSLLRDKPEARYRALLEQSPELVQQIPLKYLASYIGITPQALSRIRRRIS